MSQNTANEKTGIYINGRQQVVDLLRHMEPGDKTKLLRNLKGRNPTLAKELSEQCFSYDNLWALDDENLSKILMATKPVVLGLALSLTSIKNQKRALGLIGRENALKAYEVMTKDLSANRRECQRAQDKILDAAIELSRRQVVRFY
ncbi:MAG: FliG C-terminal domain-containing protein [Bacteriovoracia bacterium]|jgi:flagellar motor switch protein FliG